MNQYDEIKRLIESEAEVRVFPYSARQLAEKYGLNNKTVTTFLHNNGLHFTGGRWVYRNIEEREVKE